MVVQQLLQLQPKWPIHLWCCAERLGWSDMEHLQRSLPLPQVHRDEDALHLTQYMMCASVFLKSLVHSQHLTFILLQMEICRTQYTVCASVFIINIRACVADGLMYHQTCTITQAKTTLGVCVKLWLLPLLSTAILLVESFGFVLWPFLRHDKHYYSSSNWLKSWPTWNRFFKQMGVQHRWWTASSG